jgi:ATP synthase protein I
MNSSTEGNLIRGALVPSLVIGVTGMLIATLVHGEAGFFGALLAQFVVVIFFAVSLGVSVISRKLDPLTTMALALFSYFAKIAVLGLFLWALTNYTSRQRIDRVSFGIVAIAITIGWLGGEIRSFLKLRMHLPLPIPTKIPTEEER